MKRGGETLRWKCGLIFRLASFWVGVHYSAKTQRYCVNPLPCVTFWIAKPGGEIPQGPDFDSTAQLHWNCLPVEQSFYRPQSRPWLTPTATNAPCPTCGEPMNRAVSDCIYTPVKPKDIVCGELYKPCELCGRREPAYPANTGVPLKVSFEGIRIGVQVFGFKFIHRSLWVFVRYVITGEVPIG